MSEFDLWGYPRWHPGGRYVYFNQVRKSTGTIWELETSTLEARPGTALSGRPGTLHALALATDGEYLYFGWDEDMGISGSSTSCSSCGRATPRVHRWHR